nr:MAG TPA: hypothetical protein [Caudoviricetes sp.]
MQRRFAEGFTCCWQQKGKKKKLRHRFRLWRDESDTVATQHHKGLVNLLYQPPW